MADLFFNIELTPLGFFDFSGSSETGGFAQVFGPGGIIEQLQQPVLPPEPEIPLAIPEPAQFVQVQGDVTGFGTDVPEDLRGFVLENIIGPRSVRTPETSGAGGSGRGGGAAGGGGGRGGGPTPSQRRQQREAIRKEVEAIGRPTPNVPAVIRGQQGPPRPRRKIPEDVKISVKEKAAVAVGIIGGTIIGSGGLIRVGPPSAGQPPPGTVGPFPPVPGPEEIGPFPPAPVPIEETREQLEEITVSAQRRTAAQPAGGAGGPSISPPVGVGQPLPPPSPPLAIPRSVLLGILPAAALIGAATAGAAQATALAAPTAVPTPRPPPAPLPVPGSFLPPPSRPSETRVRSCDKPARKNRKTCWEGFYREFANRTDFVKWTKVDCKTRDIKEER